MDNEYIQALRKEVKKEFTADKARYWHTIGVAETSACLAMRYGVDMQKAFTAGLLHDCAKCYSDEQLIEICESNNIEITQAERLSPYLLHAKAGAFFAGTKYGIDDEDICNAIRYHSTGHPGMTPLEEIVFIADYMEPLRNKADNLDEIRALVFKDIKEAAKFCQNAYNMKDVPIETITRRINNAIKNNHNYCGRNWKVGIIQK